ncbi:MAG: CoA transferase [Deltaproteobacteria bacterium]|nr:MAG: CoA transferase [Deltaproteobacteria bacterium]
MALPLEGIRVIDSPIWQQGPVASVMLGDLGAEVIKVEAREGDPGRGILRAQGLDLSDRPNFYFEANNRNKKSLAIDLKKPRSGIMYACGEPDDPPMAIAGGIADQMGAVMLAYAVMIALFARERTGAGQEVDASHLGSMAWLQGLGLSARLMLGRALPRQPRRSAVNPLWNHYRCADDQWIALSMLQPDRYWAQFCAALEIPEAATDPRFRTMLDRMMNCTDCIALLDEVFARRPRAEWLRRLAEGGDFIFSIVNSVDDLPDDPQMVVNGYVTSFDHPTFGPTRMMGVPVRMSATPGEIRLPAPELGQHTEEILIDLLGYTWEEIARLREAEVI